MANTQSALKNIRKTHRRNIINKNNKSKLYTQIKKLKSAIEEGKKKEAREMLPDTFSILDKSVHKGIIHSNKAARCKSRLSVKVKNLLAGK